MSVVNGRWWVSVLSFPLRNSVFQSFPLQAENSFTSNDLFYLDQRKLETVATAAISRSVIAQENELSRVFASGLNKSLLPTEAADSKL